MHEMQVRRRALGFTLVELTATLAIVAILAAVAIPRFVGRTGFEARGFFDQAQSVVRTAQKVAIAQRHAAPRAPVFVVATATQMRVCYDGACTAAVADPAGGAALAVNAPAGVTLSPAVTFSFDGAGSPSIASRLSFTVSSNEAGDASRVFHVEPVTGYVFQ